VLNKPPTLYFMNQDEYMQRVATLHREAAKAVPELAVGLAEFAEIVARKFPRESITDSDVASIDAVGLYVACAIVAGLAATFGVFERLYMTSLPAALGRLQLDRAELDETLQIVREKLLVATPERGPRIVELAGRGDLGALVRVAGMRTALNLRRSRKRRAEDGADHLIDVLTDEIDPGRAVVELDARAMLKRAIEDALSRLDPSQRNLLRMHLLKRLGIDEIARLHQVHRATAARWIGRVRDQLRDDTRRVITEKYPALGVESLLQLVDSRLEISFERLLA
jgi:RNA polymerase sigma-70 factor, ECF subfamily